MNKTIATLFVVFFFSQGCLGKGFTPMEIDNHPCTPENLKKTTSYICDYKGNVICQSGWRQPTDPEESVRNPCSDPICHHAGMGCKHGICRSPNFCACEVGWEGTNCEICVRLPGCVNGNCSNELECNCYDGWAGSYCDIPECNDCKHGDCVKPNDCICHDGWMGQNCSTCQKMNGCKHGTCGDHPNTCHCDEGWEGALCDQPVCEPKCVHGTCVADKDGQKDGQKNFCICETGWKNDTCSQCVPYWNCPNQSNDACVEPNECICSGDSQGPLCSLNIKGRTRN